MNFNGFITFLLSLVLFFPQVILAEKQELKKIPVKEIIKHNSKESCWIVIDKKVYDITNYLLKHPAPLQMLLRYCGKDGSKGYKTKDVGRPHENGTDKLLKTFLIGKLAGD